MKIAIVTDKSRESLIPSEEALMEDEQKDLTVKAIKEILSKKYDCISLLADDNIISNLKSEGVDLVFNLSNGLDGDSKLAQLPAILEFAGIPYTGSSILGHSIAINKIFSSTVFKHSKIPTPKFWSISSMEDLDELELTYPLIVKPSDEGSSRGIHQDSLVFDKDSLYAKMKDSLETYNPPIMLNQYVQGREFSIGLIGNGENITVLPIQEVDLSGLPDNLLKFYSFEIKSYYKDHTKYHIPAKLTEEEQRLIEATALKAYKALQLRDYSRVDIILKDGIPYVLEINSLPGLQKEKSALYRMAEEVNLGYEGLIFKIVEVARERYGL